MRMLRHTKNEHHEDCGCGERHRYEEDKGDAGFRLHPEDNMFLDSFKHCASSERSARPRTLTELARREAVPQNDWKCFHRLLPLGDEQSAAQLPGQVAQPLL